MHLVHYYCIPLQSHNQSTVERLYLITGQPKALHASGNIIPLNYSCIMHPPSKISVHWFSQNSLISKFRSHDLGLGDQDHMTCDCDVTVLGLLLMNLILITLIFLPPSSHLPSAYIFCTSFALPWLKNAPTALLSAQRVSAITSGCAQNIYSVYTSIPPLKTLLLALGPLYLSQG